MHTVNRLDAKRTKLVNQEPKMPPRRQAPTRFSSHLRGIPTPDVPLPVRRRMRPGSTPPMRFSNRLRGSPASTDPLPVRPRRRRFLLRLPRELRDMIYIAALPPSPTLLIPLPMNPPAVTSTVTSLCLVNGQLNSEVGLEWYRRAVLSIRLDARFMPCTAHPGNCFGVMTPHLVPPLEVNYRHMELPHFHRFKRYRISFSIAPTSHIFVHMRIAARHFVAALQPRRDVELVEASFWCRQDHWADPISRLIVMAAWAALRGDFAWLSLSVRHVRLCVKLFDRNMFPANDRSSSVHVPLQHSTFRP